MQDIVRLSHYDPRWPQEFEQTRSGILQSCLGWVTDVQHIGGTSVSGMIARPLIDILAGFQPGDQSERAVSESTNFIEGLNYRRVRAPDWATDATLLVKPRHGEATHCVYLTAIDGPFWQSAIAVRDLLRKNRELALRFEETKVSRWKNGEGDPDRYAKDKAVFFSYLSERMVTNEPFQE